MGMVLVATVAWSFAGLFTRSLTLDAPTTVAWRSFSGGLLLLAPWLVLRGPAGFRDLLALGRADWAAVAASTVAQAAYTACLFLTSVAHVAVIYAFTPFIAALVAWWWLGEAIAGATLLAILASAAGVTTVMAGSLGHGSLAGDALALVMTAAFAVMIVLPKAHPGLRTVEPLMISAFITFALFLPFSHTSRLDLRNGMLVAAYGAINLVLALFLFIRGARHLPAHTAGLIATLEIVLAPLWVWLFLGERVDAATLLGAAIVAGAVVAHLAWSSDRRASGKAPSVPRNTGQLDGGRPGTHQDG